MNFSLAVNVQITRRVARFLSLMLACLLGTSNGVAQERIASDSTDTLSSDFVKVSLLVASPGDVLYSRVGHCALHMVCDSFDLDYVFSYESENVRHEVLRFLAGKLKMGMFAIPTAEYLDLYRAEGRRVLEYGLEMPLDAKRNLWRVLDNHVMEGINLPYDYMARGCAHSVFNLLKEGLDTIPLAVTEWPAEFATMTRRELTGLEMARYPWVWSFMNLICNGQIDAVCSNNEKVIMPAHLVWVLEKSMVQGRPIMAGEPAVLLDGDFVPESAEVSPLQVTLFLLCITLLLMIAYRSGMRRDNCMTMARVSGAGLKVIGILLFAVAMLTGVLTCYLVLFSDLVNTEWSWLLVPFNPLPLLFWKWRSKWMIWYAAVLLLWAVCMALWPHTVTDWPFVVLAVNLACLATAQHICEN